MLHLELQHLHENIGYLCDFKLVSIIRYDNYYSPKKKLKYWNKTFSLCEQC